LQSFTSACNHPEIDEDTSIDEFTDAIKYPNGIKIVIEQPAPSFFAGYVGFSDR